MTSMTMQPGLVLDLTVKFGNQVRHKCPHCSHYFSARESTSTCSCGAVYRKVGSEHEVVSLPHD